MSRSGEEIRFELALFAFGVVLGVLVPVSSKKRVWFVTKKAWELFVDLCKSQIEGRWSWLDEKALDINREWNGAEERT